MNEIKAKVKILDALDTLEPEELERLRQQIWATMKIAPERLRLWEALGEYLEARKEK